MLKVVKDDGRTESWTVERWSGEREEGVLPYQWEVGRGAPGLICTFYTYGDGSNHSPLALLRCASSLASMGFQVLVVDMDLWSASIGSHALGWDAPGMLESFQHTLAAKGPFTLARAPAHLCQSPLMARFDVIPARKLGTAEALAALDFDDLEAPHLETGLEALRVTWRNDWDFVFVQSARGQSTLQQLATAVLPDIVVPIVHSHNLSETAEALAACEQTRQVAVPDRGRAWIVPVAVGDARPPDAWYDWLSTDVSVPDMAERLRIPGNWIERACEDLALLLAHKLKGTQTLIHDRVKYEESARQLGWLTSGRRT